MDDDRRLLIYAEPSLLMEIHYSGNEWQEVISRILRPLLYSSWIEFWFLTVTYKDSTLPRFRIYYLVLYHGYVLKDVINEPGDPFLHKNLDGC